MQGTSRDSLAVAQERLLARAAEAQTAAAAAAFGEAGEQLFAVVGLLGEQPALRRALSDPSLPPEQRVALVNGVFSGKVGDEALQALRDLAGQRWSSPGDVVDAVEVLAVQAALTVAEAAGRLDEVEDELFRFERIVHAEPRLRAALTDPGLPADRKVSLLEALLEGKASPSTTRLVEYAVANQRRRNFERGLTELARLAASRRERLVARVTSARPLTGEHQQRLAGALARIYGREVQLQLQTDPELIGGVVVRVGDEVIDGSVLRRLDEARRRLAG